MSGLLIVGGGYAGLWAAIAAARRAEDAGKSLEIRLINKEPYLTHRPRLYECKPEDMRSPLEPILSPIGVELTIGTVREIDPTQKTVLVDDAGGDRRKMNYDALVLAAGSVLRPPPWSVRGGRTWSIDTIQEAMELDAHLAALADQPGPETVAIIGAGFTGIELATEMRVRLAAHLGDVRAEAATVILLDAAATVSEELGAGPRPYILAALESARVDVRLNAVVEHIEDNDIVLAGNNRIRAETIIVTNGPQANRLAAGLGVKTDQDGRLPVDETLAVKGLAYLYAAGDVARANTDAEHVALMSCQHAMPMGRFAGHNAAAALLGLPKLPYGQERYVTCLDLGPWGAVFTNGWQREVVAIEDEAKARKRFINGEVIYPPSGDREAILAAGAIQ